MDAFIEEGIHYFVGQDSVNAYLLEDICKIVADEVADIETQLLIHELSLRFLDPIKYNTIALEVNACASYISSVVGPT